MIYNANVTQSCKGYYNMQVTVEAKNVKEAKQLILNDEYEVEDSTIEECNPITHEDLISSLMFKTIQEIEQIIKFKDLDGVKIKAINRLVSNVLNNVPKNDIEIHLLTDENGKEYKL